MIEEAKMLTLDADDGVCPECGHSHCLDRAEVERAHAEIRRLSLALAEHEDDAEAAECAIERLRERLDAAELLIVEASAYLPSEAAESRYRRALAEWNAARSERTPRDPPCASEENE